MQDDTHAVPELSGRLLSLGVFTVSRAHRQELAERLHALDITAAQVEALYAYIRSSADSEIARRVFLKVITRPEQAKDAITDMLVANRELAIREAAAVPHYPNMMPQYCRCNGCRSIVAAGPNHAHEKARAEVLGRHVDRIIKDDITNEVRPFTKQDKDLIARWFGKAENPGKETPPAGVEHQDDMS